MKALLSLLLLLGCVVSCLGDSKADDPKSNPPTIDLTFIAEKSDSVKVGASSSPAPDSTTPSQPRKPGINFTWIIVTVIVWLVLRTIVRPKNKSQ
jgi:hypothetical protein